MSLLFYPEYRILRKMPTTFFHNVLSLLDKKRSHFTIGLEFIHRHQCNILVTHRDFTLKDDPSDVKLAMVSSCCQLPLSYIKTVNNKVLNDVKSYSYTELHSICILKFLQYQIIDTALLDNLNTYESKLGL